MPQPCPWPFYVAFFDHRHQPFVPAIPRQTKYWQLLATAGYPPFQQAYGHRGLPVCFTRASPPEYAATSVELDEVCPTKLDMAALIQLAHAIDYPDVHILTHMAQCLRSKAAFLRLFNQGSFHPGAGRASHLSQTVVNQMIQWGLLNLDTHPAFYCRCFLVLKANNVNKARLIMDSTPHNKLIDCPWRCKLTKIPVVIALVLSWSAQFFNTARVIRGTAFLWLPLKGVQRIQSSALRVYTQTGSGGVVIHGLPSNLSYGQY